MGIEIVDYDLPIENGVFHSYVSVYQRVRPNNQISYALCPTYLEVEHSMFLMAHRIYYYYYVCIHTCS